MSNKQYSAQQLAEQLGAELQGDANVMISAVAPIERAQAGQLSYIVLKKFLPYLETTQASIVIVHKQFVKESSATLLIVDNVELAYAKVAALFQVDYPITPGVAASAVVHETAQVHETASIGAQCVVGAGAVIGARSVVHAGAVISEEVVIGEDCEIHSNAMLYPRVQLGNRVMICSGVILGAPGFGLANHQGRWHRIPQLGRVVIHDDVDVGANTTIDRGALDDTVIEQGVKIDNQVQIGHNCRIGAHTAIAGCVGIAGSTTIGKYCLIGGACCINGHIEICDQVMLAGMSQVGKSITQPGQYGSGNFVQPAVNWHRNSARYMQLDSLAKRIRQLEKRLDNE